MAKQLTFSEIAAILKSGTFDDLKDALEDDHLECKKAPYQLQHDKSKYELAKDVSMIVNRSARTGSEGGHILLGVRTEKSPEHHADIVVEVSPFEPQLVNPKQYYDVLRDWLVPAPEGVIITWYPSAGNAKRGIVAITVPQQPRSRWPCLVGKVVGDDSKVSGVSIAYVERRGEHAVEWTVADFHRLLSAGDQNNAIESLREEVQAMRDRTAETAAPPGPSQALQTYKDRRGAAITAADLRGKPTYSLTAAPVYTISLPTLFKGSKDPLVKLLQQPPALRYAGFGVSLRGELEVVQGRARRTLMPGYAVLECWPDGTLIYAADAARFLCWGDKTRGKTLRLNPLALAESTYLFAMLAHRIYTEHAIPHPNSMEFGIALERMDVGGLEAVLTPGGLKSGGYLFDLDAKQAPSGNFESIEQMQEPWTPGQLAYRLTAAVYRWFGHTDENIPYVDDEDGVPAITEARIREDAG